MPSCNFDRNKMDIISLGIPELSRYLSSSTLPAAAVVAVVAVVAAVAVGVAAAASLMPCPNFVSSPPH